MKRSNSYALLVCGCLMMCAGAWRCNLQTDIYGVAANLPFVDNTDGSGKRVQPNTDNSEPYAVIEEANDDNQDASTGDHDGP